MFQTLVCQGSAKTDRSIPSKPVETARAFFESKNPAEAKSYFHYKLVIEEILPIYIAAGMATELMVAMSHHSLGHCAPAPEAKRVGSNSGAYAPVDHGTSASSSALGLLPHQIRGTVATYTMMTPTVPVFASCTVYSDLAVEEYCKEGFKFVK